MIRLGRNIILIIGILALCFIVWKVGTWWGARLVRFPDLPIFIPDTLDYDYPAYVERPSLFFRLTHPELKPRTVRPIEFKPWMDSVYSAYSVVIKDERMDIKGKRDGVSHQFTYEDVPPNVEIYGTETGFRIIRNRFENPFHWSGVLIGCQVGYSDEVVILPYVKTGINISRLTVYAGADREKIFMEGSFRLW